MVNAAEVRTGGEVGPRHPGIPRVPGVPVAPTVLSMLQSARRGLSEAADETSPGARYVTAHLAALRAAAAVVAARGEPKTRRTSLSAFAYERVTPVTIASASPAATIEAA